MEHFHFQSLSSRRTSFDAETYLDDMHTDPSMIPILSRDSRYGYSDEWLDCQWPPWTCPPTEPQNRSDTPRPENYTCWDRVPIAPPPSPAPSSDIPLFTVNALAASHVWDILPVMLPSRLSTAGSSMPSLIMTDNSGVPSSSASSSSSSDTTLHNSPLNLCPSIASPDSLGYTLVDEQFDLVAGFQDLDPSVDLGLEQLTLVPDGDACPCDECTSQDRNYADFLAIGIIPPLRAQNAVQELDYQTIAQGNRASRVTTRRSSEIFSFGASGLTCPALSDAAPSPTIGRSSTVGIPSIVTTIARRSYEQVRQSTAGGVVKSVFEDDEDGLRFPRRLLRLRRRRGCLSSRRERLRKGAKRVIRGILGCGWVQKRD